MVAEFFLEAAVLFFVFPIIDRFARLGRGGLTPRLIFGSLGIAAVLLFFAIRVAVTAESEDEHD